MEIRHRLRIRGCDIVTTCASAAVRAPLRAHQRPHDRRPKAIAATLTTPIIGHETRARRCRDGGRARVDRIRQRRHRRLRGGPTEGQLGVTLLASTRRRRCHQSCSSASRKRPVAGTTGAGDAACCGGRMCGGISDGIASAVGRPKSSSAPPHLRRRRLRDRRHDHVVAGPRRGLGERLVAALMSGTAASWSSSESATVSFSCHGIGSLVTVTRSGDSVCASISSHGWTLPRTARAGTARAPS